MIPLVSDVVSFLVSHYQLLLFLPIIMALRVEQNYVSRVATLSNTVSMFAAVAPYWNTTWPWLNFFGFPFFHAYLLVGLIFGAIAFLSYLADESPGSSFYGVSFALYNSAVAGLVCLVAAFLL